MTALGHLRIRPKLDTDSGSKQESLAFAPLSNNTKRDYQGAHRHIGAMPMKDGAAPEKYVGL